jgi:hypothetical protein
MKAWNAISRLALAFKLAQELYMSNMRDGHWRYLRWRPLDEEQRGMFALLMVFMVFGAALVVGGTLWGISNSGMVASNPPASTGHEVRPAPLIMPPAEQQ